MTTKDETVKIKKIVLDLGDKEIVLSMEQAKKLKEVLAEIFGKDVIKEVHHHHDYWWEFKQYPVYYTALENINKQNFHINCNDTVTKLSYDTMKETLCLSI